LPDYQGWLYTLFVHRYLHNPVTRVGLFLVVFGWGPLLSVIFLDSIGLWPEPDPNPIGLGILFFLTFGPALICLLVGFALTVRQKRREDRAQPTAGTLAGASVPSAETEAGVQAYAAPLADDSRATGQPAAPLLTPDQEAYMDQASWGSLLGWWYFILMGKPVAFFRHMPGNLLYTNYIKGGRRQVWESGGRPDFASFEQRSQLADTIGLYAAIGVGVLAVIVFGLVWLVKG
jgi:hypothetical protein